MLTALYFFLLFSLLYNLALLFLQEVQQKIPDVTKCFEGGTFNKDFNLVMRISIIAITLLMTASCSKSGGKHVAANDDSMMDGAKLYKTYCITCHGLNGDMGASGAFNLATTQISMEDRIKVITEGRNNMTPFKGLLSEEKIKAVAEYSAQLKKQ